MAFIYETNNFIVESPDRPHITRTDGGHIKITPKVRVLDRTELSPKLATELIRLTMIVGSAMMTGLSNKGIDVSRINYQDNGNWSVFKPEGPYLHIHLYGRAKDAKIQKYGDACYFPQRDTGFYDNFESLNSEDIKEIQNQIQIILKEEKYQDKNWGL